jgi:CRP-like cAMP-binding protein
MDVSWSAFIWGCISAVSLPLGAMIGFLIRPTQRITSLLMAFGGGALLFALTIELFAHSLHRSHESHDKMIILATVMGSVLGGLLFEFLNQILSHKGGFLRKASLLVKHVRKGKTEKMEQMVRSMGNIRFLQLLPADEIAQLIPFVNFRHYKTGEIIFRQGEPGKELFFVSRGKVHVIRTNGNSEKEIAELDAGDVFGEIALISDQPRTATVQALEETEVLILQKKDFDNLLSSSLLLQEASKKLVDERLLNISGLDESFRKEAHQWKKKALDHLNRLALPVTNRDIETELNKHKGSAALAIWLGIALDGIPESMVIGMLAVSAAASNTAMSLAFIAGVFLANLPEAMSSAVTMQRQGSKIKKIFWMWMSLCIMTGLGAMLGAGIFPAKPEGNMLYYISGIEGLAAGAMLTMIANTMLPEAFEQGGSTITGLSTLTGFISALCVKLVG